MTKLNEDPHEGLAYADDVAIYARNKTQTYAALEKVTKWAKENDMEVNKQKSQILRINGDGRGVNKVQYKTNDIINGFSTAQMIRYLGATMDASFSFFAERDVR